MTKQLLSALVVDDEPWALKGIVNSFPWEKLGVTDLMSCNDSGQAYQLLFQRRPDLVVADIRMPGLSGLDIIRFAREAAIDSEFIIVSGYNDFEYAQQAIQYGVFAYVLKPLQKDNLEQVCRRLAAHWQNKPRRPADSKLELAEKTRALLLASPVLKRLAGKNASCQVLSARLLAGQKNILDQYLPLVQAFQLAGDSYLYLLCPPADLAVLDTAACREALGMAAEDRASIGASLAFEQTSQLEEAIRQAHLARLTSEFYADQDLLHIYSQLATDEDLAVADNCTSLLTQGKTAEMLDFLQEHLLSSASGKPGLEDIVLIHNRVTAFLEDWFPLAAEDGLVSFLQYEQLAGQFGNIRAYLEDLKKNADYLAAMSPVLEQNEPKSDVFTALLEYVEENYTQAISLTDLAGIFFLSPTYICDLFRRYKKTTFTNYINSLRLGRAYKLIKQTKRPLKTIAQEAGYRNYAYFNKIFKLKYSMTPSMLRKVDASEATDS